MRQIRKENLLAADYTLTELDGLIEQKFGPVVLEKIRDQIAKSNMPNCHSLVHHLLGRELNTELTEYDIADHASIVAELKGVWNEESMIYGTRQEANVCLYNWLISKTPEIALSSLSTFRTFFHHALYIGEIDGQHIEFGQWVDERPKFYLVSEEFPILFYDYPIHE